MIRLDEKASTLKVVYRDRRVSKKEVGSCYDYGFRWYDASVGRFMGADPIADQFAWVSPYNYAENKPVNHVDLWGLQGVFANDGSLIGYSVQQGQGPTQIAKDLNDNYSCYTTCEPSYVDIVQDNAGQFANAINPDGSVQDKFSDNFKSGNIDPGDVLSITDGKAGGQYGEIKAGIDVALKDARSDSAEAATLAESYEGHINIVDQSVKDAGDDWTAGTLGKTAGKAGFKATLAQTKNRYRKKEKEATRKIDSLKSEREKYE